MTGADAAAPQTDALSGQTEEAPETDPPAAESDTGGPEADVPRPEKPPRRRMFFALNPDAATRAAIVRGTRRAVSAAGGRPTRPENLHMTIAFIGRLTAKQVAKARAVPPIQVGPIQILLDRQGYWSRQQIVWLGTSKAPAALIDLERRLWEGLKAANFMRERGMFRPHVTLARRARAARAAIRPVRWTVTSLALLESLPDANGTRYELVEQWPL
jgi:2'-5' RNA ligase